MNILIVPGELTASLAAMESLAKQGHQVFLADQDSFCAGFSSKYCKKGIVIPSETNEEAFLNAIKCLIISNKFDLIIPTSDLVTHILSVHRERILPYTRMLLPSKELIEIARCKDKTYRFALDHDIAIPATYFPSSLQEVNRLAQYINFPCVVKKPKGTANKGNTYFYHKTDLIQHYQNLKKHEEWPVIQEYIQGDFYAFLGIAHQGEIIEGMMYKTEQKYTTGGVSPYCCSVVDQRYLKTARRIIKKLNWTGAINIDFLKSVDGHLLMLEINPRLSGSLTFGCKLGLHLLTTYISIALGKDEKILENLRYKPNVIFRYVLPAEILYAMRNKNQIFKLCMNFFNLRIKTDIPWNDRGLLVAQLWHLWWYIQDKVKKKGESNAQLVKKFAPFDSNVDSELLQAVSRQRILQASKDL